MSVSNRIAHQYAQRYVNHACPLYEHIKDHYLYRQCFLFKNHNINGDYKITRRRSPPTKSCFPVGRLDKFCSTASPALTLVEVESLRSKPTHVAEKGSDTKSTCRSVWTHTWRSPPPKSSPRLFCGVRKVSSLWGDPSFHRHQKLTETFPPLNAPLKQRVHRFHIPAPSVGFTMGWKEREPFWGGGVRLSQWRRLCQINTPSITVSSYSISYNVWYSLIIDFIFSKTKIIIHVSCACFFIFWSTARNCPTVPNSGISAPQKIQFRVPGTS